MSTSIFDLGQRGVLRRSSRPTLPKPPVSANTSSVAASAASTWPPSVLTRWRRKSISPARHSHASSVPSRMPRTIACASASTKGGREVDLGPPEEVGVAGLERRDAPARGRGSAGTAPVLARVGVLDARRAPRPRRAGERLGGEPRVQLRARAGRPRAAASSARSRKRASQASVATSPPSARARAAEAARGPEVLRDHRALGDGRPSCPAWRLRAAGSR